MFGKRVFQDNEGNWVVELLKDGEPQIQQDFDPENMKYLTEVRANELADQFYSIATSVVTPPPAPQPPTIEERMKSAEDAIMQLMLGGTI